MINVNFTQYRYYGDYFLINQKNAEEKEDFSGISAKEVVVTWKYDEDGNIVYYTYDKKTGELISKVKYKNPYKDFIKNQGK